MVQWSEEIGREWGKNNQTFWAWYNHPPSPTLIFFYSYPYILLNPGVPNERNYFGKLSFLTEKRSGIFKLFEELEEAVDPGPLWLSHQKKSTLPSSSCLSPLCLPPWLPHCGTAPTLLLLGGTVTTVSPRCCCQDQSQTTGSWPPGNSPSGDVG